MEYVLFFSEVNQNDLEKIGHKGLNLAMLFKKGFKVPPGFIISSKVFNIILERKEIKSAVNELMRCQPSEFTERATNIQRMIKNLEFPEPIADEIIESYLSLCVDMDKMTAASLLQTEEVYVAVRSSFVEDIQLKSILNVKGRGRLFKAILDCYATNFNEEVVKRDSAIIVQKMVDSEKSGVAYSVNPETKNPDEIVVNACFGLGEGISSGNVFPDTYLVNKKTMEIKATKISEKQYEYVRDIDTDLTIKQTLGAKSHQQVLLDKEITEIARIVKKIVNTFEKEQKIEWAIKKDSIYILQAKDIGAIVKTTVEREVYENEELPRVIDIVEQPDVEEDLLALEEIEKIEKTQDTPVEEELIKGEESIFSEYRGFDTVEKRSHIDRLQELANLNAGNVILYCHMVVKEKLKQRLKKYVKDIPEELTNLVDELLDYEKVDREEEIRKLDRIKNDFIIKLKYPEPAEVEMGLRLAKV